MSTVPDLALEVNGWYEGGAYATWSLFSVRLTVLDTGGAFALTLRDTGDWVHGSLVLSTAEAEAVIDMAGRDHGLAAYEDDWSLPPGLGRALFWDLPADGPAAAQLNAAQIDEVAAWLRYATGADTWEGGDEWEY